MRRNDLSGEPQDLQRRTLDIAARMERLPPTKALWKIIVLISLGGWFEIYDLFFTGYIAPGLIRSGMVVQETSAILGFSGMGAFIASMFAGLFIGTFFLGSLADRFGRRRIFTLSLLWYSTATAIMAFQSDISGLLFWRFVAGVGVGVQVVAMDSYIADMMPTRMRGRAFALNHVVMFTAVPTVALLSWRLVPLEPFGMDGWRWVVLAGSLGALMIFAIQRGISEPPTWLAASGRIVEAEIEIEKIERAVEADFGKPLPAPVAAVGALTHTRAHISEVLSKPFRAVFLMLIVYNVCQAIGFYGFANWVPSLLIAKDITVTKSLFYSFVIAFAYPIGPLLAMTYADRIERKWVIVGAAVCIACIGSLMAISTHPAMLVILGAALTLSNITMSYTYHAYQVEVFPPRIRAQAAGIVYSASRLGAMSSGFIIAYSLAHHGVSGVFGLIALMMGVVIVVISLFGPRVGVSRGGAKGDPSQAGVIPQTEP